MTDPLSKQKASRVVLEGVCWEDVPIEQVVTELQCLVFHQLAAINPGYFPAGLHLVYLPARATEPIRVTLRIEEAIALPELLDLLAEEAAVIVFWSETGIVLVPIATVDHENGDQFDAEEAAGLTIPGLTSTFDEVPPPAPPLPPVQEPTPTASVHLIPGLDELEQIDFKYPALRGGVATSPACRRFSDLARACQWWPGYLVGCADLVMIYENQELSNE